MAKQATITNLLMVALIAVILGGAYMLMGAKAPLNTTGQGNDGSGGATGGDSIVAGAGVGYATTVQVSNINAISKASITDARGYLFDGDNSAVANDVALTSATTSLTTSAPNSLNGYAMIGNDANQGTDGGGEWYYKKVPVSYTGKGYVSVHDEGIAKVQLYAESTSATITGYEDNTVESSLNVTVGTSPVKTAKLKFEPAASSALGNPQLSNPLGVCFNVTTDSNWNDITPYGVKYNKITTPEAYKGYNVIGCYEFTDTDAIADDSGVHNSEYTFGVNLDPAANPANESLAAYLMDKTYYLDDNLVFQVGFADNSLKGTDYDVGFDGYTNAKVFTAF